MIKVSLRDGQQIKIDKEYVSEINKYSWYTCDNGSGGIKIINVGGKNQLVLHRVIASKICNVKGKVVSFIDNDVFNLTKKNLLIRDRGKQSQKYEMYSDRLFQNIDEPWKAYFLGWMYADGCMANSRSCRLALHNKDQSILQFFTRKIFRSSKPLFNMKSHNEKLFTINNKTACNDLINLGLVPRKSLILAFPTNQQVPTKFLPYFVRGYFEGDGSVFLCKRKGSHVKIPGIGICLTKQFGKKLLSYLANYGIKSHVRLTTTIHVLSIRKYDSICKFFRLIYSQTDPFVLVRKYNKLKLIYESRLLTNHENSSSKYCGIHRSKTLKIRRWIASMNVKGVVHHLGRFNTEEAALKAKTDFLNEIGLTC